MNATERESGTNTVDKHNSDYHVKDCMYLFEYFFAQCSHHCL